MVRSRPWCFTINNPTDDEKVIPNDEFITNNNIRYLYYSLEEGEEQTPHFQGYVYFNNPRTMAGIKRISFFARSHLEPSRGSVESNVRYISKAPIEGPYEFGTRPEQQGKRNDLILFKEAVMSGTIISYDMCLLEFPLLCARYPRYVKELLGLRNKTRSRALYTEYVSGEMDKKVEIRYGPPGSGKTSHVYRKYDIDDIYKLNLGDGSSKSLWFDDYNGEAVLLIDDFYGNVRYNYLLRLLDIYPLRCQSKGSFVHVNFSRIYITSNSHPEEWYPNVEDTRALFRRITKIKEVTGDSITLSPLCQQIIEFDKDSDEEL